MNPMAPFVAELEAEQRELQDLLRPLARDRWLLPTPAAGWDVRDQISHLADIEEVAADTATGGPRSLNVEATTFSSPEAFTEAGCDRGRAMEPADVLAWWEDGCEHIRDVLLSKDPKERVPWGLGMSARAFVTARHMETWAHGHDVRVALDAPIPFGERHRNIAWLVTNALPYAFTVAGRPKPDGELRVELNAPGARTWAIGPEAAADRITGDALEFCLVGIQRLTRADARTLKAEGPLADAFLDVARAFL